MEEEVQVVARPVDDVMVLDITGDVTTAAEERIVEAYESGTRAGVRKFVLNFSGVEYVNSSGIAIVISLITRVRAQGQKLSIFGLSRHFQKMFKIVGVDRYSTICQTEDEALASV
jgi:anti-anti-sigma factor